MAQVQYADGVPSVAPATDVPNDYQKIQSSPADFGGLIAQGEEKLGAGATEAGKFYSQVSGQDAYNNFQSAAQKIMYGDPTKTTTGPDGKPIADTGYKGLTGQAAMDAAPKVQQQLDELYDQTKSGLYTPESEFYFEQTARRFKTMIEGSIGEHYDQQQKTYASDVSNATITTNKNLAASAQINGDTQGLAHAYDGILGARVKQAQLLGGGDDLMSGAKLQADRDFATARITALSANDPASAQKLLDGYATVLAGSPEYDQLASQIRARATEKNGDALGQDSLVKVGAPVIGGSPSGQSPTATTVSGPNPNNIGNVKTLYGAQTGAPDYVQPATPVDGVILAANNLRSGYQGMTLDQIGHKWEGTAAYPTWVANVSKETGWAPNYTPNLNDPAQMQTLLHGISTAEKSKSDLANFTPAVIQQGVQASLSGAQPQTGPATLKAGAYDNIMKSDASPEVKQRAIEFVNRQSQAAMVAAAADEQARKQANDQAAGGYVTRMLKGDLSGIVDQIADDPKLTWETKRALGDAAEKKVGSDVNEASEAYGPGFWNAYKAVNAPTDDPTRIADPTMLLRRAGPGGDLTLAGAEKLSGILKQNQASVNDQSVNTTKLGLFNYAKNQLSFEEDTGPIKIRDPKGEAIFNAQFIPKFEAGYDQWIKAGKNPWEFLTQDNVDKMTAGMRDKNQMALDRMAATGETPPGVQPQEDTAPLPAPPQGANPDAWKSIVSAPPPTTDGGQFTHAAWGQALGMLIQNPTPENIAAFNQSKFGRAGYSGQELIDRLKGKSADEGGFSVQPKDFDLLEAMPP